MGEQGTTVCKLPLWTMLMFLFTSTCVCYLFYILMGLYDRVLFGFINPCLFHNFKVTQSRRCQGRPVGASPTVSDHTPT